MQFTRNMSPRVATINGGDRRRNSPDCPSLRRRARAARRALRCWRARRASASAWTRRRALLAVCPACRPLSHPPISTQTPFLSATMSYVDYGTVATRRSDFTSREFERTCLAVSVCGNAKSGWSRGTRAPSRGALAASSCLDPTRTSHVELTHAKASPATAVLFIPSPLIPAPVASAQFEPWPRFRGWTCCPKRRTRPHRSSQHKLLRPLRPVSSPT